jgi:predicted MFS family arabinose efflux permease
MQSGERPTIRTPYLPLVLSVFPLIRQHREILISGAIQALGFAQFIALWLALALYLTSPEMGYGTDDVGYLAALAAVSIFSTPRLGRWADRTGPRKARLVFALFQLAGISLLWFLSSSIWLITVPLLLINLVGPGIDVTGRMTFLSLQPDLRTRLTTIYVVMMFVGGGLGSLAGTWVYDTHGWGGTCILLAVMSMLLTFFATVSRRFGD